MEPDLVVHHAFLARHRGLLGQEKREPHLQVRRGSVQAYLHLAKDVREVLDVDDRAMRIEDLHEAAHVGALEFLGQIHEQAEGGHRVLEVA